MSDFVADAHEIKAIQICEKFDLPHPHKRVRKSVDLTYKEPPFPTMTNETSTQYTENTQRDAGPEPWVERIKEMSLDIQRKKRGYFYKSVQVPDIKAKREQMAEMQKKIQEEKKSRMVPKNEEVGFI